MTQQKTIFITGGSGYIGSTVIEFAIRDGYEVIALSRAESSDDHLKRLGAIPIRGDLSTHDVLTRQAAKADIVIGIADAIAGKIGQISAEERVRINTAAIDALAEGLKGTQKPLILTSGSLVAAADPDGKETNEESPRWVESPFSTGQEEYALAIKNKGAISVVRLAPWVYGRGGSGVKLFMGMFARMNDAFYVEDGAFITSTVHVEDAARLYLLLAKKAPAGEAYNTTSETNVTQKELIEAIGKALQLPVRSQSYADTEAKFGAFLANFLRVQNRASSKKAEKELGWRPKAEFGILDEIARGSYVEVAEELRKK